MKSKQKSIHRASVTSTGSALPHSPKKIPEIIQPDPFSPSETVTVQNNASSSFDIQISKINHEISKITQSTSFNQGTTNFNQNASFNENSSFQSSSRSSSKRNSTIQIHSCPGTTITRNLMSRNSSFQNSGYHSYYSQQNSSSSLKVASYNQLSSNPSFNHELNSTSNIYTKVLEF